MRCPNCGSDIPDDKKFCTVCGSPLTGAGSGTGGAFSGAGSVFGSTDSAFSGSGSTFSGADSAFSGSGSTFSGADSTFGNTGSSFSGAAGPSPYAASFDPNMLPEEYRPLSMWAYFGYQLLFSIPLVGFVCLLIFSFGGTHNRNLKNFARSYFCLFIIAVILVIILAAIGGFAYFYSY